MAKQKRTPKTMEKSFRIVVKPNGRFALQGQHAGRWHTIGIYQTRELAEVKMAEAKKM